MLYRSKIARVLCPVGHDGLVLIDLQRFVGLIGHRVAKLVLGVRITVHLLLGFFVDNRFEIICMFVWMFVWMFVHTSPP